MEDVAVVSAVQVGHAPNLRNKTVPDLVYEAARAAMEQAGVSRAEIDSVVEVGSDYWDGHACSNISTLASSGAYMKDETKVESDGLFGFLYGYMKVASGLHDVALICAYTKSSEGVGLARFSNLILDPLFLRPIGLQWGSISALEAVLYSRRHAQPLEQVMAEVTVKNLCNALGNVHAHRGMRLKPEEVAASPLVAYPLRQLHCAPESDGACAVVIASSARARRLTDTPVWVRGVGWASEAYFPGERDLVRPISLIQASRRAYRMAGIGDPLKDLDVAEVYDISAFNELLWYEGLGFCEEGEAVRLIQERVTRRDGGLPVNPSGGLLGANPILASGLVRLAEVYLQVSGKARGHQVHGAEVGLAHSVEGYQNSIHGVVVLGR